MINLTHRLTTSSSVHRPDSTAGFCASLASLALVFSLAPGPAAAQKTATFITRDNTDVLDKASDLQCPEIIFLGEQVVFTGTFTNTGHEPIGNVSFTVTVTTHLELSEFTTTQGAWTPGIHSASLSMGTVAPVVTVTFTFVISSVQLGTATLTGQFGGQNAESCDIEIAEPPFIEIDRFESTTGLIQLTGGPLGDAVVAPVLHGPAEVHVFFDGSHAGDADDDDGNGLDEVETELVSLSLTDGSITLRTNPAQRSFGAIEERVNNTPGTLDLDPFASGVADSYFEVLVEVEVGGQIFHNQQALLLGAVIHSKPPFERYVHLIPPGGAVELFDQNNHPTGIFIVKAIHSTGFVEIDLFEQTTALVELVGGFFGNVPVPFIVTGPAEIHVFFDGTEGAARDDDDSGLDEVETELVRMDLTDGLVHLRTNQQLPSLGLIEEKVNNNPGWLDLDPFHPGDANSFFDVFFEVEALGFRLFNNTPLRVEAMISEKPPFDRYVHLIPPGGPLELVDDHGRGTGIFIVKAEHNTGFVEWDHFESTTALIQLAGGVLGDEPVPFILRGPAEAHVFFEGKEQGTAKDDDGDGLDEVTSELGLLDLRDNAIRLRLNQLRPSPGEIEEKVNNNPGRLDLDPFHPGDANSFFDVFFEIDFSGLPLHNDRAFRIESMIKEKPPWDRYIHFVDPDSLIELFDQNNQPTGVFIVKAEHFTGHTAIRGFKPTSPTVLNLIRDADGATEEIQLTGPTTVHVYYEGPEGAARDHDGDGLAEIETEMVSMMLTGVSPSLGSIEVRLNPRLPSIGQITEHMNSTPDVLDIDPFAPGDGTSIFDAFFEVEVGSANKRVGVWHTEQPKRLSALITEEPDPRATFSSQDVTPLLDEAGQPAGFSIGSMNHMPLDSHTDALPQSIPSEFALSANYPNPFPTTTSITFALPRREHVRLSIYDMLGRRVDAVVDRVADAGVHTVVVDARQLVNGVYVYRFQAGQFSVARLLTVSR